MRDDFAELAVLDRDGPREPAKIVREHNLLAVRHCGDMADAATELHLVNLSQPPVPTPAVSSFAWRTIRPPFIFLTVR